MKSEGKKAWKKFYFVLRQSGLYYCPKGKSSRSSKDLVCLATLESNQVCVLTHYPITTNLFFLDSSLVIPQGSWPSNPEPSRKNTASTGFSNRSLSLGMATSASRDYSQKTTENIKERQTATTIPLSSCKVI